RRERARHGARHVALAPRGSPGQPGVVIQKGNRRRGKKKPLPDFREGRSVSYPYLSRPYRVGVSTCVAGEATGCCGFKGPNPSATLDKIPNQVVSVDSRIPRAA